MTKEQIQIAYNFLNKRERDEDVIQDAIIKVLNNIDKYNKDKYTFESFVSIVYSNIKKDHYDKINKHKNVSTFTHYDFKNTSPSENYVLSPHLLSDELSAENNIINQERNEMLLNLINTLRPKEKRIFELYFIENKTKKEICKIENIKAEYLNLIFHRGKEHLKKKYKKISSK